MRESTSYVIVLLLVLFLFLLSCRPEVDVEIVSENRTINLDLQSDDTVSTNLSASICNPQWTCLNSREKIFRFENCSLGDRQECTLGCFDDNCRVGGTCSSGFKCKGGHIRAYQTESCEWIQEKKCDFGCQDAKCLTEPNETVTDAQLEDEVVEKPAPLPTLNTGEFITVESEGVEYDVSIHFIEADQVKIRIGNKRSDWLEAGESFTANGIKITVSEILFQAYVGGKQSVVYKLE